MLLRERPLQSRTWHSQTPCGLSRGQSCHQGQPFRIDFASWSPESHTLRPGPCETGHDPFAQACPFKFCNGPQYVQLEASGWGGRVNALSQADEADAEGGQFIDHHDQMPKISAQTIQAPNDHDIVLASFQVPEHGIKGRAFVFGPAEPTIYKLRCRPAPRLDVAAEFVKLIFRFLLERADPRVDGCSHGCTPGGKSK
jgi:hypothetical protein